MTRNLALAAVGLALAAGSAAANGPYPYPYGQPHHGGGFSPQLPPGYVALNAGTTLSWGHPGQGSGQPSGGLFGWGRSRGPYQLGPWYQYWPYEAHFQVPAVPQYPYWGAQTLPGGLPYVAPGMQGHG